MVTINIDSDIREILETVAEGHTDDNWMCHYCGKDTVYNDGAHAPNCVTTIAKEVLYELEQRYYDS